MIRAFPPPFLGGQRVGGEGKEVEGHCFKLPNRLKSNAMANKKPNNFYLIQCKGYFYCVPLKELLTSDAAAVNEGDLVGFRYGSSTFREGNVLLVAGKFFLLSFLVKSCASNVIQIVFKLRNRTPLLFLTYLFYVCHAAVCSSFL